ncbi:putative LRR receptor-like serine/threonine-protein kinase At1g06840 [Tasmannia lanceolata]|uniref:putative LRR receptor-like serine/threonine-protein kinase At1g06840 n=1 Tax=Tasmannia lanceolata TaxID=3420 RepID=UPI0040648330
MSGVRVCVFGAILWCFTGLLVGAQVTAPSEVSALRAIRSSLNDPLKHLNWTKGDPCTSDWRGVLCFNATLDDGYLHIQELQLLNMNLSGSLAPEVGQFPHIKILDFMWNKISGSIPKEIGNLTSLELLLLSGNQLSGSLPDEIGYLPNLNRIQIDQNYISGPLPKSLANLERAKHFHMNNNSISGQIPPELARLLKLVHLLLDNNNLSGYLPPELSQLPYLFLLQLDNNHFDSEIPASYGNMLELVKLSLRNCSLRGAVPDLSMIPGLNYLDLSWNQLTGPIPSNKLSANVTTIDLSNNKLSGSIPANFSDFPLLQRLSLENNSLSGSVPSTIWQNVTFSATARLILDFQNNLLSNISGILNPPVNITIRLQGNPVCMNANQNIVQFCGSENRGDDTPRNSTKSPIGCPHFTCPTENFFEYVPGSPVPCFCAAPLRVGYRLKSPGFLAFPPYVEHFEVYLTSGLELDFHQLSIDSCIWEEGPRLRMYLKIFPLFNNQSGNITRQFNVSEVLWIRGFFTGWKIPYSKFFGPYELLNFTLQGPYSNVLPDSIRTGLSKGAVAGIALGMVAVVVMVSAIVLILIRRRDAKRHHEISRKRQSKSKEPLSFSMRSRITLGSAKGILYLHTEADPPIFHRDIKASNILLDSKFTTKVADFGLSRLAPVPDDEGVVPAHVSTAVKGTPGYLDPEYFLTHKLTDKSDVYSLGIVLLELLTGMPPISHGKNIAREVNIAYQTGMLLSVIDSRMGSYPSESAEQFVALALRCCRDEENRRPSMAEVVREVENICSVIPEAETTTTPESTTTNYRETSTTPSASTATNQNMSSESHGNDNLSDIVSTIIPR